MQSSAVKSAVKRRSSHYIQIKPYKCAQTRRTDRLLKRSFDFCLTGETVLHIVWEQCIEKISVRNLHILCPVSESKCKQHRDYSFEKGGEQTRHSPVFTFDDYLIKPTCLLMIPMTLNQLRYFCTDAQCHSITKAAKIMFVTQPAVSLALRELEKKFSITLFSHSNNGLELTVEGEQFYERASALLRQSDEMQLEFQDTSRRRPTVRLGTPPNLSTVFFPELMDAFHVEHPEIYLELSEYGSVRACDMVQNGRC